MPRHFEHNSDRINTLIGGHEYRPEVATAILERRIHPDINSLAEELESSHAHEGEKNEAEVGHEHSKEPSDLEKVGFVGLKPSARRHRLHKEAPHKNNKLKSKRAEHPHIQAAFLSKGKHENPSYNLPIQQDFVRRGCTELNSSMKWSTLLKRPHAPTVIEGISQDTVIDSTTKSASQSSLEKSQSFDMSHRRSNSYGRTGHLPRTPNSETNSGHQHTPSYSAGSPGKTNALPSPHIFGPSRSDNSEQDESYFDFKEIPPPLPPLNHPAFRKGPPSSFKFPTARYNFPALPSSQASSIHTQESPAGRQTARSLPSLKRSKGKRARKSGKDSHRSLRSPSTVRTEPQSDTKHHLHSRRQSENSIATFASSRRSSAEYSAKQASSIAEGIHGRRKGCWEVEVSKAMLSLALGREDQPRVVEAAPRRQSTSSFGNRWARGKNRARGGALELGSPFLLQDIRRDNLKDSQLTRDYFGCTLSSTESPNSIAVIGQDNLPNTVMSNGESILRSTGSTSINGIRKGKERAPPDTPSPPGSHSRRTGRAISNPSSSLRLTTPPEHARLDTASVFGTIHSSSTLQPPQVAIIQATPDASPITLTTKRGHHKSTPTMPTASVLKTASAPPLIEKSYSNGSSKRKADDAGVNGDKTPPKESREARTTFAPEPRPHRASTTSGMSTHAPSSFNRSKRVRLSESSEGRGSHRPASRASILPTPNDSPPNAKNTGSWSSRGSHGPMSHSSHNYGPPPAPSASHASYQSNSQTHHRPPSRRSLSQASIPISALISPHAPSIGRLSTFHMRDPRKPNPIQNTPWSLSFPLSAEPDDSRWSWRGWVERGGSPLHAWLFFIGFIFFPLWWAAALFIPIPRTRTLGEPVDTEKGVMLDDPQLEHDAKSWRTRCRVMAGVSLLTYVPFIILVAIFA